MWKASFLAFVLLDFLSQRLHLNNERSNESFRFLNTLELNKKRDPIYEN